MIFFISSGSAFHQFTDPAFNFFSGKIFYGDTVARRLNLSFRDFQRFCHDRRQFFAFKGNLRFHGLLLWPLNVKRESVLLWDVSQRLSVGSNFSVEDAAEATKETEPG